MGCCLSPAKILLFVEIHNSFHLFCKYISICNGNIFSVRMDNISITGYKRTLNKIDLVRYGGTNDLGLSGIGIGECVKNIEHR